MQYKHVEWAYPTSPLADKHGHSHDGCWVVVVWDTRYATELNHGPFASIAAAERFADTIGAKWLPDYLRHCKIGSRFNLEHYRDAVVLAAAMRDQTKSTWYIYQDGDGRFRLTESFKEAFNKPYPAKYWDRVTYHPAVENE